MFAYATLGDIYSRSLTCMDMCCHKYVMVMVIEFDINAGAVRWAFSLILPLCTKGNSEVQVIIFKHSNFLHILWVVCDYLLSTKQEKFIGHRCNFRDNCLSKTHGKSVS